MEFSASTFWWVAVGTLVAAELMSGTFYLLMIALGSSAGAIAAHVGWGVPAQVVVAALVGGGATVLWHWTRFNGPRLPASECRDLNLDIGERVNVENWEPDRTARVTHRGAQWRARLAPDASGRPGLYRISAIEGNWLVLRPSDS